MIVLYPTFLLGLAPREQLELSSIAVIGPNSLLARRRRPVDTHDQVLIDVLHDRTIRT